MKNYSTYVDREMIEKIIEAHSFGIIQNAISDQEISEMRAMGEEYLPNLNCSERTKDFVDDFLSQVKQCEETGIGSNFAQNYISLSKQE